MGQPKYLKNRVTGAIFPYNKHLALRNKNVEPVFDEVDVGLAGGDQGGDTGGDNSGDHGGDQGGDTGGNPGDQGGAENDEPLMIGETPLADASKDQMIEFAQQAFGAKLSKSKTAEVLRDELAQLIKAAE